MSVATDDCFHLTVDIVRQIHSEVIATFGGLSGLRDENLLVSAVLTPQTSFSGKSPFRDLIEIAAAYLFYLCSNHPFADGNKHVSMMAAIVFLRLNDIEVAPDGARWERLMFDVAAGQMDREATTRAFRKLVLSGREAKKPRKT